MGILIFLATQINFGKVQGLYDILFLNYHIKWGRFDPSNLGHNFFVFQIFVISRVTFAIKSCLNQLIKQTDSYSRDLLEKNFIFL